ncbi:MAG: hypothetical protein SOW59_09490, partial [Corynebacterium sp.]|nr:hypothetical protein [Corynebacterium sp.]
MSVRFSSAGGYTTAQDWLTLATLARDCGDGNVYLSAMSTIELRNVSDVAEVHQKLETTGLRTNKCQVLAHPLSLPARTFAANLAVELPAEISASHVINVVDIAHPRPSHNATVEVVLLDAGEQ